jgi:hypothetical protein
MVRFDGACGHGACGFGGGNFGFGFGFAFAGVVVAGGCGGSFSGASDGSCGLELLFG